MLHCRHYQDLVARYEDVAESTGRGHHLPSSTVGSDSNSGRMLRILGDELRDIIQSMEIKVSHPFPFQPSLGAQRAHWLMMTPVILRVIKFQSCGKSSIHPAKPEALHNLMMTIWLSGITITIIITMIPQSILERRMKVEVAVTVYPFRE